MLLGLALLVEILLPNHFTPRPYQREPMAFFDAGGKRALTVWHRRGGKDLTAMHQTAKQAHKRPAPYWHVFPTETQGRKAIWEGFTKDGERIMEQVFPRALRTYPREFRPAGEMVVEMKCGALWRLIGSDKMEVVGAGPAGVVISEYALSHPRTFDLIRPMLRENDGWAWINTTPRGKNHAWNLYQRVKDDPSWFVDVKTLFDTRAYDPEATIAEERASGMPEELIAQEYLCDWTAALVGSFYGTQLAEMERRGDIGLFEASGLDDVFTFWDLGRSDDTAIWWMRPRGPERFEVLDHYAGHGFDPPHYFEVVDQRGKEHGWHYRCHYLPHDARAKTAATRLSYIEQASEHFGPGNVAITPELTLKDGIAAVRWFLPRARIHKRCCAVVGPRDCDGIEALKAYHREWSDEAKCFSETPVHDWSSHTADAARYMAVASRYVELVTRKPEPKAPPPRPVPGSYFQDDPDELFR